MEAKNYAEVLIDGKIYTLGGSEDERYLQRVASYINDKTAQLKKQPGFTKQSQDYQTVMVELNIADDYFKMLDESLEAKQQKEDMEKETYSLKHELVTTQMKLEAVLKELEELQKRPAKNEQEIKRLKEENQKLRAMKAASEHAGAAGGNSGGQKK